MFRDTDEELERLQALLLAETEEQEQTDQAQEEELPDEDDFSELLWDTDQGENPEVYQNYSNDYGRDLRNYATGYQAYNTDKTDTDLEEYSQEVLDSSKTAGVWLWVVLILMAAVVGAIVWILISAGGVF